MAKDKPGIMEDILERFVLGFVLFSTTAAWILFLCGLRISVLRVNPFFLVCRSSLDSSSLLL